MCLVLAALHVCFALILQTEQFNMMLKNGPLKGVLCVPITTLGSIENIMWNVLLHISTEWRAPNIMVTTTPFYYKDPIHHTFNTVISFLDLQPHQSWWSSSKTASLSVLGVLRRGVVSGCVDIAE